MADALFLPQFNQALDVLELYVLLNLVRISQMQTIQLGYRGLRLLVDLNWDRGLYLGVLTAGLMAGLWLCSLETGMFISK